MNQPLDDWPRPESQIKFELALARTILAWNECEKAMTMFLSPLTFGDQMRARVIWAALPTFDAKRKMLLRMSAAFTPKETHTKLKKLLDRGSNLAKNRNRLAHAWGGYNEKSCKVELYEDTQDDDLGTNFLGRHVYNLSDVESWPHAIRAYIMDLMAFLPEFSDQVSASSRMHQQEPRS